MRNQKNLRSIALFLAASAAAAFVACAEDGSGTTIGDADAGNGETSTSSSGTTGIANTSSSSGKTSSSSSSSSGSTSSSSSSGSTSSSSSSSSGGISDPTAFWVARVGATGGGALSNAAAPVFLEERTFTGGSTAAKTITLPVAASGANLPITVGGTSTSEAGLTTSADGAYVMIAGYPLAPGTAAVKTVAGKRVIGRISAAGTIDTSTQIENAFALESVRAACSIDGNSFWVTGTYDIPDGGANLGGVHYATLGSTGARTQVYAELPNLRHCGIFGSQLYATTGQITGNPNTLRLFSVGAGTPNTAGQAGTQLPGFQNDGNPQGFVMLDVGATGSPNRLYVADAASVGTATSGGVQRWEKVGNSWNKTATFKGQLGSIGIAHVAAAEIQGKVYVIAVTLENPSRLIRYIDDGSANIGSAVVATAATGTQFRGITRAPK